MDFGDCPCKTCTPFEILHSGFTFYDPLGFDSFGILSALDWGATMPELIRDEIGIFGTN